MIYGVVSREAVLKICAERVWNGFDDYYPITANAIAEKVRQLPSAQPEPEELKRPQWIPCSVRLPRKTDLYFVTIRDNKNDIEYTSCMDYWVKLSRWEVDVNVIAWMPLPEPYGVEE